MGGIAVGEEGSATGWETVFNICNCAIGAGMLSFPYAFRLSGLLGGICLCAIVVFIEFMTLNILTRQSSKHGAITYQGLVRSGLGHIASEVMSWTILFFLFGSCVAYIIIVGDNFSAVLRAYVIEPLELPSFLEARQVTILASSVIILAISLQRSMVSLAPTSTMALIVMTMTTGVVVAKGVFKLMSEGIADAQEQVALFNFDMRAVAAIPIMVFAYHCHIQAVPLFYELTFTPSLFRFGKRSSGPLPSGHGAQSAAREPPVATKPGNTADEGDESMHLIPPPVASRTRMDVVRKLRGMSSVMAVAYFNCTAVYIATGIAGYFLYPQNAQSNILNNFSPDDNLMQVMRLTVGIAVLLHYPINQHVARSALYDLMCHYLGTVPPAHVPYSHVAGITLVFFAACVTTACLVTDLGIMYQIIGGIAGSLLVFILPGGLIIAHCRHKYRRDASVDADPAPQDSDIRLRSSFDLIDVESASRTCIEHFDGVKRRTSSPESPTTSAAAERRDIEAFLLPRASAYTMLFDAGKDGTLESEWLGWSLVSLGVIVLCITVYITLHP